MPKFLSNRDITFFKGIARELVDDVIENVCILFKVNLSETKVNLYGESLNKTWYPGVELSVIIDKDDNTANYEGFGPDNSQGITFKFDRFMCEERKSYPEIGDVIYFDKSYYEINNTREVQYVGGMPQITDRTDTDYSRNFSIVCDTIMVRKSSLNIEERVN
jgi:hypothetical protein